MAKVYKIWNEKLEVFRAVKILLPTQQADLKSRFETEAKITAKLHHPNIVEIYSVGEWNSLPYLEMEFIDGVSLETLIGKHGKLPNPVCSAIAILIARALEYAHSQEFLIYGKTYKGVIHRDLKPANIMIPTIGDVRLMDFGIARPTEASLHTVEGNIVGTMQYLSPEQMDGVDIDARTDIYSFGAILYEMLTGTKTFPQDTITNLMKKKIMNEYRKFSEFHFHVSPHLARISQKCLQIDKNDRYPNMEALIEELEVAHKSLTSEAPVKILKKYLSNPSTISDSSKGSFRIKLSPKVLIPAVAVAVISALVAVFIITGPESVSEEDAQKTVKKTISEEPVEPKKSVSTSTAEGELQPLGPEDEQTKKAEIPVPTPPEPKPKPKKPVSPKKDAVASFKSPKNLPPMPKKPEPELSPLDALKKKYGSSDLITIGKSALKAHVSADAILALENIPAGDPNTTTKTLLLFEAYLAGNKIKDALYIANSENISDAQFDYLCGRLYEQTGKNKRALDYFQTALTKPSIIRSRGAIRNDALFQIAILWTARYKSNPSGDTRIQALNAWNTVKRTYMATPNHPRFRRANEELATIR
jgi:serine/threonine protein kinase